MVEVREGDEEIELGEIELVEMKEVGDKKGMRGELCGVLLEKIGEGVEEKEEVMLLEKGGGFGGMIEWGRCGWVGGWKKWEVSVRYEKGVEEVRCDYWGYR